MVISTPVGYGILAAVGALALLGFIVVFIRLGGGASKPLRSSHRPPAPVGWPITPATPSTAEPSKPRAAPPRPDGS
jgi:hypothetical protein